MHRNVSYAFGGAIKAPHISYVNYLIPGIIVMTAIFGTLTTGLGLTEDLKAGVVDRFRSLPIARSAVLIGRTAADLTVNVLSLIVMAADRARGRLPAEPAGLRSGAGFCARAGVRVRVLVDQRVCGPGGARSGDRAADGQKVPPRLSSRARHARLAARTNASGLSPVAAAEQVSAEADGAAGSRLYRSPRVGGCSAGAGQRRCWLRAHDKVIDGPGVVRADVVRSPAGAKRFALRCEFADEV